MARAVLCHVCDRSERLLPSESTSSSWCLATLLRRMSMTRVRALSLLPRSLPPFPDSLSDFLCVGCSDSEDCSGLGEWDDAELERLCGYKQAGFSSLPYVDFWNGRTDVPIPH